MPPGPARPRSVRRCCSPTPARRPSGPATSTRRWAPTWSASSGLLRMAGRRAAGRGGRLRRAAHAGRAGGPARRRVARRRRARLDRCGRPSQQARRDRCRRDHDGDEVTFDFTGTDAQRRGNVNAVEAVTVSAVSFALRAAVDPTIPANGGALRPVRVVAPAGTIVAARAPAAVGAGNVEVSQRVADVCFGRWPSPAASGCAAAGQGTMNNVLIGGDGLGVLRDGRRRSGRPPRPGGHERRPHGHDQHAGTRRSRRWSGRSRCGCCATGCGGGAAARARRRAARASSGTSQVLEDCTVSLITERRVSRPWGLAGGEPGAPGENWLLPDGDERRAERLPDKCTIQLAGRRRPAHAHPRRRRVGTTTGQLLQWVGVLKGWLEPKRSGGRRSGPVGTVCATVGLPSWLLDHPGAQSDLRGGVQPCSVTPGFGPGETDRCGLPLAVCERSSWTPG